jgi:DNA polymerase III alpha subunit
MLAWNAERRLRPVAEIERRFADRPEALETAWRFIDRAAGFTLDELRYEYPDEVVPSGVTPMQHLRDLVWRGARERYPRGVPAKVARQFEHEFAIIDDLRYAPYFLTVHDIVAFARGRGILCQGRGAAANSAVCFALGVTAVDPDRIDVLFERFVSRERNEPPDIDIDFEHERREEVIQHIYRKYGRHRAALVCEVISYRGRSAVRDVGKALGFTPDAIGRLAGSIDRWSGGGLGHRDDPSGAAREESLRAAGLDPSAPRVRQLVALVGEILGFPRHRSQHVGGFIISRGALGEMVPIEHAAMEDRSIIEWDKDDIEALGMLKIDILSLGMLTAIRKTIDLVNGDRAALADGADGASPSDASKPRRDLVMAGVIGAGARHSGSVEADARVAPAPASAPASAHILASHEVDRPAARPIGSGSPASSSPASSSPASSSPASSSPASFPSSSIGAPCAGDGPMRSADRSRREVLRFHAIPPEDPSTYDMICIADTIGVFQIESRAQMSMLPRLRPRSFYDLVVEVAIVRPGPIQGDMVHPYLRRRSGEEPVRYPNDAIRKVLGKTLGVPLFQEQAMALAVVAAGFTPGQADELRRAIAAWKRSGNQIARFGEALEEGMVARGYSRTFAKQVFEQIKGFSGYGFPESHAASFALLVYASAWLKRHHPAAFAAALLNSQPMGFYAPAQIVRDAKEHGVAVRGIDIHCSRWDSTLERGPDVGPALADEARRACGGVQQTFAWSSCDGSGAADAARGRAPSPSVEGSARSRMSRSSTVRIDAGLGASLAAIARREQRDAACDELPDEPPDKPPDESRDQSPPAECVASINAATASDAADPAEMHLLERFRWSGASDEADSCFRGVRIQRWERMDADSRSTSVRRDLALERLHGRGRSVTVGGDEGDLSPIRAAEPLAPPSPSPSSHDFASHTSPARMRTLPSSQTVGAESESEFEFEFESEGPPAIAAEPVRDDPARFAVPTQPALRLGLRLVRGLTAEEAQRIVEAVARAGPFRRIADLADSARIGRSTLRKLAAADAFGSMGLDRQQANWQILAWREQTCEADGAPAPSLWSGPARAGSETETIEPALPEVAELSAIAQDLEATGISLKRHPIACLRDRLQRARAIPCGFLREETRTPDRKIVVVAGIVLIRQRPSTAKGIVFMTIEDETGVANLVIRPRVYERLRGVLRHAAAVCVRGRVERRHGVVHVLVGAGRDITRRLEVDPDAGSVRPMDARPSPGASGQGVISEGTGAPRGGGLPKTVDPSGNHVDHVDHVDHVRGTGVRATDDALLAHDDAPRAPGRTGAFRRSRDFH